MRPWCLTIAASLAACGRAPVSHEIVRADVRSDSTNGSSPIDDDRFEGVISGIHFAIRIGNAKLIEAQPHSYAWLAGVARDSRVTLQDSGPIADETRYLVARSPRTIVRDDDGIWVVTEVVTTARGRVFTCLHEQPINRQAVQQTEILKARGVATCRTLELDTDTQASRTGTRKP